MSESNSFTNITSDGNVVTYDKHGVRIKEYCGDLSMIHVILEVVKMSAKDKAKLPEKLRLRSTNFNFVREDEDFMFPVPIKHITEFVKYVKEGKSKEFISDLLLQIPLK